MLQRVKFPGDLSVEEFLRDYWQKQPLYMPGALTGFSDPISPDELAGFACEEEIKSRMVMHQPKKKNTPAEWTVRYGPFNEHDFAKLPTSHWCLLVQVVNRYAQQLNQLLSEFDFLPDWRIDDVMVSYAEANGTVGPHYDYYDVFLLQGMGSRRWQIHCDGDNELLEQCELRILKNFSAQQEYLLKPGDMLYLPAGVQHYGVSEQPCMTYSIGFRAPDQLELVSQYIDHNLLQCTPEQLHRYRDHALDGARDCGRITGAAVDQIKQLLLSMPMDNERIGHWFGGYITDVGAGVDDIPLDAHNQHEFLEQLQMHDHLFRDAHSRFAYRDKPPGIELFVNGASCEIGGAVVELVKYLCNHRRYPRQELARWLENEECVSLLTAWWQQDWLQFDEE